LEVYSRRAGSTAGAAPSVSSALLAWGPPADQRWKELLAVVEAEDDAQAAISSEEAANKGESKSRDSGEKAAAAVPAGAPAKGAANTQELKITSSSGHSATVASDAVSGGTAASAAAAKKIKKRRPLLIFFPFHNQPELLGAYRAMLLADR
jgi:hypothetical protein